MEMPLKKSPANEHIECLLQSGKSFAACYVDLDHVNPFNSKYGYKKGDELIQFTGKILGQVCESNLDFIGHISGGDFIVIMQSNDWEKRCHRALVEFAQSSCTLFDKAHRSMGGYILEDRQSRIIHYPLPTLSIGAAWITPTSFESHYEVIEAATVARNMAKKESGNSLFIERRHPHPYRPATTHHQSTEVYHG